MTARAEVNPKLFLLKRIQLMMGLLSLQFVLGMVLNTMGEPEPSTSHSISVLWHSILILHILVGIGLLASAAYILIYAAKNNSWLKKPALISFIGITLATIFGSLTISHFHEELMSFFMAIGFLVAIGTYGRSLEKIDGN